MALTEKQWSHLRSLVKSGAYRPGDVAAALNTYLPALLELSDERGRRLASAELDLALLGGGLMVEAEYASTFSVFGFRRRMLLEWKKKVEQIQKKLEGP